NSRSVRAAINAPQDREKEGAMSNLNGNLQKQAGKLQQEYVDKRKRHINKRDDQKVNAVQAVIEGLHKKYNIIADWLTTYRKITRNLQASDLVINIEAASWFSKENNYATYAQMYERGITNGKMVLTDAAKGNEGRGRAQADDVDSLPEEWGRAHPFSQRKRLWKAMSATGMKASNVGSDKQGKKLVETDSQGKKVKDGGVAGQQGAKSYITKNPTFNPYTKQVFAALNYG